MTAPIYRCRCHLTGAVGETCPHAAELDRLRDENAELQVRVQELTALAAAQADEIRSLNLQLDQARGRGGW